MKIGNLFRYANEEKRHSCVVQTCVILKIMASKKKPYTTMKLQNI